MERKYDWSAMAATHLVATVVAPVCMLLLVYMLFESWAAAVAAAVAIAMVYIGTARIMIRRGSPVGKVFSRWLGRRTLNRPPPSSGSERFRRRWPCVLAGAGIALAAYIVLAVVLGFAAGLLAVKGVVPLSVSGMADFASGVAGLYLGVLFGRRCWWRKTHRGVGEDPQQPVTT